MLNFMVNAVTLHNACRLGVHGWGEWRFVSVSRKAQYRQCVDPNCKKMETRKTRWR